MNIPEGYKLVPLELLTRYVESVEGHGYGFEGDDEMRAILDAPVPPQADAQPVACEHEWTDDGEFLLVCTKCGAQENHEPYGWVQTRGDAINRFTQEWDIVEAWEEQGFEYKAMYDHADAGEVERLKALSVTNIMLDVVPGEEGMGEEVYAKSVEEVEEALGAMGLKIEDLMTEPDTLRAQLAEWGALLKQAGDVIHIMTGHDSYPRLRHQYGEKWWEPIDELRGKIRAALSASAEPEAMNFDQARMETALAGKREAMPEGLSREQFREWMLHQADYFKTEKGE